MIIIKYIYYTYNTHQNTFFNVVGFPFRIANEPSTRAVCVYVTCSTITGRFERGGDLRLKLGASIRIPLYVYICR